MKASVVFFCCFLFLLHQACGQEWWFWPKYTLGQRAANYPGNRIESPTTIAKVVSPASVPLLFHGEEPTERITNFLEPEKIPAGPFTAELWLVNHVNQKIGALVTLKDRSGVQEPEWLLGISGKDVIYTLKSEGAPFANIVSHEIEARGWKKYWFHLVAVYDGANMKLYLNGALVKTLPAGKRRSYDPSQLELEVAAYLKNEPYMDLGNFVKMLSLHANALTDAAIAERFKQLNTMVEEGKLYPDLFHFNAGPYLNNVTATSISVVWETDRSADFVVAYGQQVPLDKKMTISSQSLKREPGPGQSNIYKITLTGLDPETPYFYNIKAKAFDGTEMESGILTFTTAVKPASAFAFGVIGDTEARPHINDRVSKLLWDERPNFIMLVGDLTDGGVKDHKFEWNYEYFQGMTQIASRVPVFPVPGNGEDDLFWYDQYHVLPAKQGYYTFSYGNADFFMLDSNQPQEFAPGGKQYVWLEEQLRRSTAQWKFVAHHHAPYSADEDDYGNSWKGTSTSGDPAIRKITELYERYKVDMVFFGHLHTYQRSLPIRNNLVDKTNGVIYVQGGGGGGNLEDFAPSRAWFSAKTYRGHHYFTVSVHGNTLNFKMYDTQGSLKDYLDLKK